MAITIDGAGTITGLSATGISSQPVFAGNVLQVVRATDSTDRTTTSASFVDAGISVTITPTSSNSAVLLVWSFSADTQTGSSSARLQITDSSNTAISGAEEVPQFNAAGRLIRGMVLVAYATPSTTSAVTFKGRMKVSSGTFVIHNNTFVTGQLFAIEVAG